MLVVVLMGPMVVVLDTAAGEVETAAEEFSSAAAVATVPDVFIPVD